MTNRVKRQETLFIIVFVISLLVIHMILPKSYNDPFTAGFVVGGLSVAIAARLQRME